MPFTYDPTTDRGKVRLLITDVEVSDASKQLFQDAEIDAFLAMNTGVKRAAAAALLTIAASEALVGKVLRTQDLQSDGAKLADALRALAKQLRAEADRDEDDAADAADDGGFSIVNFDPHAAYRLRY